MVRSHNLHRKVIIFHYGFSGGEGDRNLYCLLALVFAAGADRWPIACWKRRCFHVPLFSSLEIFLLYANTSGRLARLYSSRRLKGRRWSTRHLLKLWAFLGDYLSPLFLPCVEGPHKASLILSCCSSKTFRGRVATSRNQQVAISHLLLLHLSSKRGWKDCSFKAARGCNLSPSWCICPPSLGGGVAASRGQKSLSLHLLPKQLRVLCTIVLLYTGVVRWPIVFWKEPKGCCFHVLLLFSRVLKFSCWWKRGSTLP